MIKKESEFPAEKLRSIETPYKKIAWRDDFRDRLHELQKRDVLRRTRVLVESASEEWFEELKEGGYSGPRVRKPEYSEGFTVTDETDSDRLTLVYLSSAYRGPYTKQSHRFKLTYEADGRSEEYFIKTEPASPVPDTSRFRTVNEMKSAEQAATLLESRFGDRVGVILPQLSYESAQNRYIVSNFVDYPVMDSRFFESEYHKFDLSKSDVEKLRQRLDEVETFLRSNDFIDVQDRQFFYEPGGKIIAFDLHTK